jgi:hypothetical protein
MNSWLVTVLAASVLLALAGCSDPAPQPTAASSTPVLPTFPSLDPTAGSAGPSTPPVHVDVRLSVPASPATEALVAYTRAHAESVIAGRSSAELRAVTSRHLLAYQQQVIAAARAKGFAVPTRPRMAVVSGSDAGPGRKRLGVCYWLPSVQYIDASSGAPTDEVPSTWVGAVALVTRVRSAGRPMTWIVAKVEAPTKRDEVDCGR